MTRRLVLSYLTIALFVLIVLEVPLGVSFARSQRDRLTVDIERDAVVIGSLVEDDLQAGRDRVDPALGDYTERAGSRVVITDRAGVSVHDSAAPTGPRRDFSTRPEIIEALAGRRATGIRHSETLGVDLLYVAVPVASGGQVHGAVRITYPTQALDRRIAGNWWLLAVVAAVVLVATAAAGWAIARWVTRPTRQLERAVALAAAGDLTVRAPTDQGPPEVRALARRFNVMAAQLDRLLGAQRAFVADASHQLRSPLTALRLELEDLPVVGGEGEDGRERAIEETRRLGRLVDGLLLLARSDGEGRRPEPIDVAAVVRGRVATWRPLAEESGVSLQLEDAGLPRARAVAGHLEQILDNLIANALEVSPVGSTVTVSVTTGDVVAVHVRDEGPGLEAEERDRAFDRFWRGPAAEPGTGSGLGLPIARQLARAVGGDVVLLAVDGGGTDAVVTLPAADPS